MNEFISFLVQLIAGVLIGLFIGAKAVKQSVESNSLKEEIQRLQSDVHHLTNQTIASDQRLAEFLSIDPAIKKLDQFSKYANPLLVWWNAADANFIAECGEETAYGETMIDAIRNMKADDQ